MPSPMRRKPRHQEHHFQGSQIIHDIVIGLSDGLTVPFALAAGLSGAVASGRIVVVAGLAEIAAGSIAMGLGGYLAARGDRQHYEAEYAREWRETEELPDEERREVAAILREQGLPEADADTVVEALSRDREKWVRFMMRFELNLEEPDPRQAPISAATIGISYIVGGLVPLLPYMLVADLKGALYISVAMTLVALGLFGTIKGRLTGLSAWRSGVQMAAIGGLAAAVAFGLARLVSDWG